ncbi:MAG: membrane associated rhomboid family serine protease [Verrucomicrobiales bacterium]|jgi:membrane associated rhomboid family serine protease
MSIFRKIAPNRTFIGSVLFYLILVNFIIFACQSAGLMREHRLLGGMVELMQFGSLAREDLVNRYEYWRLLTYMFVHDVPLPVHVGLNMLMVFVCGRVVQILVDGWAVLKIYLLGGLLGGVAHILVFPDPIAGASAAAYALLVALGMLIPERRVFVLLGLILPVRMRIKFLVWGMILVTVAFFFIDLIAGQGAEIPMISGIGHLAHLGGALGGYLYCKWAKIGQPLSKFDLQVQRAAAEARANAPQWSAHPSPFQPNSDAHVPSPEFEAFKMTEIDPIMDKIVREGFLSLSQAERDTLKLGLQRMSRT